MRILRAAEDGALLLRNFGFTVNVRLSIRRSRRVSAISTMVYVVLVRKSYLNMVVLNGFRLAALLLRAAAYHVDHYAVQVLLCRVISTVVHLNVILILLVRRHRARLYLRIAERRGRGILVVGANGIVTRGLFIGRYAMRRAYSVNVIRRRRLVRIVLNVAPLFRLSVPHDLLRTRISTIEVVNGRTHDYHREVTRHLIRDLKVTRYCVVSLKVDHRVILLNGREYDRRAACVWCSAFLFRTTGVRVIVRSAGGKGVGSI